MIRMGNIPRLLFAIHARMWEEQRAAQLVEFAVSLPLLMLFVVGIFDFSGAFTLKQKLTNVTRDAARAAAAEPANDLSSTFTAGSAPVSVIDAFHIVDNYLLANQISDCGVTASNVTSTGTLTWQFTPSGGGSASCGIVLTINRGYAFPSTGAALPGVSCASQTIGTHTAVVATCVSIQYTYQWRFGGVSRILGANTALPPQISAVSVAVNEN